MRCEHAEIYTTADKIGVTCISPQVNTSGGGSKRITSDMVCHSCEHYEPKGFWPTMRHWVAHPLKLFGLS
jgi:hypothetical protein